MVPAEARASAGCILGEVISDQVSAIRGQEEKLSVISFQL